MITLTDNQNCCGCQACANICPQHCISMKADEEGFLYPQADKSLCVNCNLCEAVCPILNKPATSSVQEAYAARHSSPEVKLKSSSGGIFTALAEEILKEKGIIFGAAFDENWRVVHAWADNLQDLDKLRRSKYVQSDIGKTYRKVKAFLEQGRCVLFTGTPCQIAGLRNYLGKEYENLLTADIICHAVPSPAVWYKFLHENFEVSAIKAINFREKRIGWRNFYLSFLLPHGLNAHGENRTFLEAIHFKFQASAAALIYYNAFLKGFLRELINRPSCSKCPFKGLNNRVSDLTLGDLWGEWPGIINRADERFGISVLLVNTSKGKIYFEKICSRIVFQAVDAQRVVKFNPALITSIEPHPKRGEFFKRVKQEKLRSLIPTLLGEKPFLKRVFRFAWYQLQQLIKKLTQ